MVLVLREDCAELQLKLALLLHFFKSDHCVFLLIECALLNHVDALFKVNDALVQHAKLLKAHGHIVKGCERDVLVPLGIVQ